VITRHYRVNDVGEVQVAMDFAQKGVEEQGIVCLKQVLMTKPRRDMIRRTPLATPRRWDWYIRKDGKRTRTGHTSGTSKALRNAVQNDPVRDAPGRKNTVTFGAHATATLGYAPYVHEALKPREGEYWSEGMYGYGRGWTTQNTGNKFVTRAVEDNADYIPEAVNKRLDELLRAGRA